MKLIRPPKDYASIEAFYDEAQEDRRRKSSEVDYGVWWTDPYAIDHPNYRISFVRNTGELYEINEDNATETFGRVRLLAIFDDYDECEWALDGWAEMCGRGGMRWLRDRLERAVPKYVCSHCIQWRLQADYTFDPDRACRTCNKKQWVLDPMHERERLVTRPEAPKEKTA